MKILHVGQMIGGLDIYIRNSIIYNPSNNDYIIVRGKLDNNKPVIRKGISIKEYSISLYRALNPFKDLMALCQICNIIKKEKPDIIHCHSAKGGLLGRIAGYICGVRTFYTPHAFSFLCTPSKIKRTIFLLLERITKAHAYVLACSESEQEMAFQEVGYTKSHSLVWHNAVPDASLEEGNPIVVKDPFVCYIGRPCYQKNPLFLLDVIKEVKDRGYNLKFFLLGVGHYSPELNIMKEKINKLGLEKTIQLEPWISHSDCQEYVRNSLFYLTTSLYEGLPLAVIEAMANSKAIVASNVVGNIDCITNDINGYLLSLDVNSFADRICELVDNPNTRKKMEKSSRELFLENFHILKQIEKLQEIYES